MKHTPGPWEAHYNPNRKRWEVGNYRIHAPDPLQVKALILDFHDVKKHPNDITVAEANAHLIAAAPDLLEALQDMLDGWDMDASKGGPIPHKDRWNILAKAERALNKALAKPEGK